ncbi:hypothetical protein GOV13_04320, partial [Candidatus Pacearchaeota archaeon]|nr:hypothetical protein [Candidatus Pacearchaeota archaeon]
MPTKYDVFAKVIEKAPCKPKDLEFKTPIYIHINSLAKLGWIKKSEHGTLIPISNKKTHEVFEIIKWSLKNNINPNIWFSKNFNNILKILQKESPKINPKQLSANARNTAIINFLVKYQFILIYQKSPKLGTLLNHKMLTFLQDYHERKVKINEKYLSPKKIKELILKTKRR